MKRTYAAISILVMVFIIAVFANFSINNNIKNIENKLTDIKNTAADGDFGAVHILTSELTSEFNRCKPLLKIFVRKEYISNADSALSGFTAYSSKENAADLICEVDKAAAFLDMLRSYY